MAIEHRILIVGCGPGSPDLITPAAQNAAQSAEVLVGFPRLLELFPACGRHRISADSNTDRLLDQLDALLRAGRRLTVLVSGDPGLYSLAQNIIGRFGRENCALIPAVSSVQVAFARLRLDWADARILSAHGRVPALSPQELHSSDKIAILAGTMDAIRWAASLAANLRETHVAFLCEDLTLPQEKVRQLQPKELMDCAASSLAIVVLVRRELL